MALDPTRTVLGNGVTVIAKANHTTPAVSVLIGVRAGGYGDLVDREGTAALCARVLDRGTITRPAEVIADDLDGRGASVSVVTGRHQTAISATCLAADFGAVLSLTADIVRHPAFPDAEVATRRADLISAIRQDDDSPAFVAVDAFARALYGSHPYGRKLRGTVSSVEGLRRQDLVRFYQRGFQPQATTVVVVGDIEAAVAIAAVAQALGDWPSLARASQDQAASATPAEPAVVPVPDAVAPTTRRLVTVPMMNKAQADLAYGFVGIRRAHPDYIAYSVMNNALGQYAIGGRLGDSIRERQGMAYYVFSSLDASLGAGPFTIRAGVSAGNVDRTITSIDTELGAVLQTGFTAQQIDESKSYLVGSLPHQIETNAAIASFLLTAEFFDLGLDYDVRLPDLIQAVSLDAANVAARQLLDPSRATIAVAGPWHADADSHQGHR